jgi:hypothetical protein
VSEQPAAEGTVSPDGQFVWDGSQWRPIARWTWRPTSWSRPLQYSVAAYLLLYGAYQALSPFVFAAQIRSQIRRQAESSPGVDPAAVGQMVDVAITVGIVTAVLIGAILVLFGILSAVRRITWVFYADLVLLALFGAVGSAGSVIGLALRAAAPDQVQASLGVAFPLVGLVLFVCALVARLRSGVWAGRRVPVPA